MYCHMPYNVRSYLTTREGSGAITCPAALYPVSLLTRAPALSRVPWLRILPPCSGGLWRCHVSRISLCTADLKNKERVRWPTYAARLTCLQGMTARYRDAWHLSHHGPAKQAGMQRSQCMQGMQTCRYNVTAVQRQHYGPVVWHRYSAKW
jgi:hypothetical protein